jgi:magnesium-transporting ATPase (P-type)
VIAQRKGNERYNVFIKGAPEIIAELCDPVTGTISIAQTRSF